MSPSSEYATGFIAYDDSGDDFILAADGEWIEVSRSGAEHAEHNPELRSAANLDGNTSTSGHGASVGTGCPAVNSIAGTNL
jgi:hypothetical protein